jgi:hypothetical protein
LKLAAAVPLFAASAFGWGCDGHEMVALIARAHLTPAASAAVNQMLENNPMKPVLDRFCRSNPADLMAFAATWADDAKPGEKTGEWHYIDIPLAVRTLGSDVDIMKWCEPIGPSVDGKDRPGCLTNALDLEIKTLRDSTVSPAERTKALRYVIHLTGDLSQPLHADDNHDQGGNCTRLQAFGGDRPTNLHSTWDSGIITWDRTRENASVEQYAALIEKGFEGRWHLWGENGTDVQGWARESHELARDVVYGDLGTRIPVMAANAGNADKTACDAERDLVAGLGIKIDESYGNQTVPVIREQIAKAAYRLAGILNEIFK